MYPQQPPSSPFLSLFSLSHTVDVGRETLGQPSVFNLRVGSRFLLVMQRVKAFWAPRWDPKEGGSFPHLLAATGLVRPHPLSPQPLFPRTPCTPLKCQAGSVPAQLRKPHAGPGSPTRAVAVPDPRGRGTRIPPLGSGPARRLPRGRACLGTARRSPAAAESREPIPTWHRARCSFFPQLQRGERPGGSLGAPSASPGPRVREGVGGSRGWRWEASQKPGWDG